MNPFVSFYEYLKLPRFKISSNGSIGQNLKETLSLFIVVFVLEVILLYPLMKLIGMDDMDHAMESLMDTMPSYLIAFFAIVAAPIIEEFIFRYPLKNSYLMEILLWMFLGMLGFLVGQNIIEDQAWIFAVAFVLMRIIYFVSNISSEDKNIRFQSNYSKNFPIYFYGVAVFFAFVHVSNFQINPDQWMFVPVLVIPQFLLGLLLGYIRMKYGILYCILVHALNNSIPIAAMILAKDLIQ